MYLVDVSLLGELENRAGYHTFIGLQYSLCEEN